MKGFVRNNLLLSLCGLNCGLCTMHLGGYCPGCGGGEGNQSCKIARCSLEHGSPAYCSGCESYPCEKYQGVDEFDSFITHRRRDADLRRVGEIGEEAYCAEQREKIEILTFLLDGFNDGRRKSFFAAAVNLLELPELRETIRQLAQEPDDLPVKEKSARAAGLLRQAAEARGVILTLRKKK